MMALTLKDLDGKYRVSSTSDYRGPVPLKSDGITEIKDGRTSRVDAAGCRWNTVLTLLSDDEVKLESTADPRDADVDFMLTDEGGRLTQDPITYTTTLKISRKGDKIRLSGNIEHGGTHTMLTLTKTE